MHSTHPSPLTDQLPCSTLTLNSLCMHTQLPDYNQHLYYLDVFLFYVQIKLVYSLSESLCLFLSKFFAVLVKCFHISSIYFNESNFIIIYSNNEQSDNTVTDQQKIKEMKSTKKVFLKTEACTIIKYAFINFLLITGNLNSVFESSQILHFCIFKKKTMWLNSGLTIIFQPCFLEIMSLCNFDYAAVVNELCYIIIIIITLCCDATSFLN